MICDSLWAVCDTLSIWDIPMSVQESVLTSLIPIECTLIYTITFFTINYLIMENYIFKRIYIYRQDRQCKKRVKIKIEKQDIKNCKVVI